MSQENATCCVDIDYPNCRKRNIGTTGLVECLMGPTTCQWALSFGYGHLCKHPLAQQTDKTDEPGLPS